MKDQGERHRNDVMGGLHRQRLARRIGGTPYLFFKPDGHPVNSGRMQKSHQMTGGWNA